MVGALIAAVLLVRAVAVEFVLLSGSSQVSQTISDEQRYWTLVLWNPWFLLGGLTFAFAAGSCRLATVRV